ncbi:MAG: membrane protein DedA with SNARE-associated domain [Cyclobacteriaceae bacterium]|jgi:membrane protein DedA with SNARE-associated domain
MDKQSVFKAKYLLSNLAKGLVWLLVIIGIFLLVKKYYGDVYLDFMGSISDQPLLVFLVFIASEVFFGIIPPELFMIWALKAEEEIGSSYFLIVAFLALLSYASGVIGYYFGLRFSKSKFYQNIKEKFAAPFERKVRRFGGYMIAVAALTPIPYSAICMLTGAARFNFVHFLLWGIFRLARFLFYGYIMLQVDKI